MVQPGEPLVLRDGRSRVTLGGGTVTGYRPQGAGTGGARRAAKRATPGVEFATISDRSQAQLPPRAVALATRFDDEGPRARSDRQLEAEERQLLTALCERGLIVRLAHGRHASPGAVTAARSALTEILAESGRVTLPELRDRLAVSRDQAKAFLDYFDSIALTRRRPDDTRVLRRTRVP